MSWVSLKFIAETRICDGHKYFDIIIKIKVISTSTMSLPLTVATLQMTTKTQLFRLKMTVRRMEKFMRVKLIGHKLEFYVKETIPQ